MDCLLLLQEAEKYYTLEKHTAAARLYCCCRFQETASLSLVCVCVCERISYSAIQTELSLIRSLAVCSSFLALLANKRASSDLFVFYLSQKKISLQSNKTQTHTRDRAMRHTKAAVATEEHDFGISFGLRYETFSYLCVCNIDN